MKRKGNIFEFLISDENLSAAIDEVNKTHHWHKGHKPNSCTAWVEETKPDRIKELRDLIESGFESNPPRQEERYDASAQKWRLISEPKQWPDQYVHHALILAIKPVLMRGMDPYCCGSIPGRGGRLVKESLEKWMKKDRKGTKHGLECDIYHFYDSITPQAVMQRMRQLIKDHRTLDLIYRLTKDGVYIGYYPSQWLANALLQPLDQMIRQSGLAKHYVRYMDNLTILGSNKRHLHELRRQISEWLERHGLRLKGDWQVYPTRSRLPRAVGYRYGRGYTIPKKHNLLRTKRQVTRYRKKRAEGKEVSAKFAAGLLSRLGQLEGCSSTRIKEEIFQGEKLLKELKNIVRKHHKKGEILEWTTYLAQREEMRSLRQKVPSTAA